VGDVLRDAILKECRQAYGLGVVVDWVVREQTIDERNEADSNYVRHLDQREALDARLEQHDGAAERRRREADAASRRIAIIDEQIETLIKENPRAIGGPEHERLTKARSAEKARQEAAARQSDFLPPSERRAAIADQSQPPRDDPSGGGATPRGRGGP
jgi:hypothetical protein